MSEFVNTATLVLTWQSPTVSAASTQGTLISRFVTEGLEDVFNIKILRSTHTVRTSDV